MRLLWGRTLRWRGTRKKSLLRGGEGSLKGGQGHLRELLCRGTYSFFMGTHRGMRGVLPWVRFA